MKTAPNNANSVILSEEFKSVSFGIKKDGLAHIFSVLRNQLYSDKILAVIREYSANALDANVEAGNEDRLIEITCPSYHDPVFKVRDFGLGLNEDEIRDIYANYGESTKRNSNKLIGQLGLGSKAAFAYGENFVINSYVNGKKIIYNAYIDPTQIGMIAKMGEEDSSEPNGVEICVPVRINDIWSFQSKIVSFFRFWNPVPVIHGVDITENLLPAPLIEGINWKYYKSHKNDFNSVVTMGNVAYPIHFDLISVEIKRIFEKKYGANFVTPQIILLKNFIFNANIGDLEVSASRESLQYTDYTKNNIVSIIEKAVEELAEKIDNSIQQCEDIFAASRLFCSYNSNLFSSYDKLSSLCKDIKWKGLGLSENGIHLNRRVILKMHDGGIGFTFTHYSKTSRSRKNALASPSDCLLFQQDELNIIDDCNNKGIRGTVSDLIISQKKYSKICVIRIKDQETWLAALDEKLLKDYKFVKASDIVSSYSLPVKNTGFKIKNDKHLKKTFCLSVNSGTWYSKPINSDFWRPVDIDLRTQAGVWMPIKRFEFLGSRNSMPAKILIKRLNDFCDALGIAIPNFYGFKKQPKKNTLNPNLLNIKDWMENTVFEYLSNRNELSQFADFIKLKETFISNSTEYFIKYLKNSKHLEIINNNFCKNLIQQHTELKSILENKTFAKIYQSLVTFQPVDDLNAKISDKAKNQFAERNKEFLENYPIFEFIDESFYGWKHNQEFDKVVISILK